MRLLLLTILLTACLTAWTSVDAQAPKKEFVPLAGIPGVTTDQPSLIDYLNALFRVTISLAALFAVVKITFSGVRYMMSEGFTDKAAAKKSIWGALAGLLIILSTVIILDIINPDILNLNIFQSLPN